MINDSSVSVVVVEDEPHARRRLRDLIRSVPWLRFVGEASTGREAITAINAHRPDLVFLDIRLPGISGIDVLSRAAHHPAVIFTTAYDAFAVKAFELAAVDYLLKPFGQERFKRALERARPLLLDPPASTADRAREALGEGVLRRLFAKDAGRIVPIRTAAIEWLQACDDTVIVHSEGRQYRVNIPLGDLEQRLDRRVFVRIHRSSVINLDLVTSWVPYDGSRFQVTLRSGRTLLASRQRSRELRHLGR